jgi:tRNA(Ile)-lysidine synthase TilS/MesJ
MSRARCVALLSGGLDSMLAIRIMQEQGVQVHAVNFRTIFTCCQNRSAQAARTLGVPLTVIAQEDDYLDVIRHPRFGYGKGANPCVDCRIYMFRLARRYMEQIGADFIVSGEVLGQRPKSQKRRDLMAISYHSDLDDLLLRPLSARMLPPTSPEREGLVNRDQLYRFWGRNRKGLIQLARQFGFREIPHPSTGCALTEVHFSKKVHDLLKRYPDAKRWDFEILKMGRHFRFDDSAKVVVGRREGENQQLEYMHSLPEASSTAALRPHNYRGALALVIGPLTDDVARFAGGLLCRYGKVGPVAEPQIEVLERHRRWIMPIGPCSVAQRARTLAAVS